jgi:predicted  nucleic acid-binding Zn-ribbon protein
VAEAYREALEASNDDASALREQVIGLENELADTIVKMERASEDRERIGAEYAYLARNYNDLKRKSSSEGGATSSSSSSSSASAASAAAAAEEKVAALTGEIGSYMSRIADAETRLAGLETSLAEAKSDAGRWRTMHDDASDRASRAAAARDVEHAEEMRAAGEYHELRISEARRSLEEARARMISENDANANVLRAEFDRSLEENSKMISALRAALRKTRRESRTRIEGKSLSSSSSSDDLDDVRAKMTEEVANLRSVLKSVQGQMDEKEREVLRAMEGRGETEKLMEEVR